MIGLIDTEGECAEWILPAEPSAVRLARHDVRDTLRAWRLPRAVADVAMLLVSELVTNSLCYAPGPIGVRIELRTPRSGDDVLRVEVSDQLPGAPVEQHDAGPDDEGGRGLQLVACSARRWGTRRGKTGKTVWFELPLHG